MDILTDVLQHHLQVVFVGTAAGSASARRGAYYAGPGNKFWTILADTGLTPARLSPEQYSTLLTYGLGLTDVVKGQFGADREIRPNAADVARLKERLAWYQPQWIAFNGKTAARWASQHKDLTYGERHPGWGRSRLVILPSTSGAARGFWDPSYWYWLAQNVMHS